jgi:hypothetical protein
MDRRAVEEALRTRRSVCALRPDPVSRETVEGPLALASRSPSGSIPPCKVRVVAEAPCERASADATTASSARPSA